MNNEKILIVEDERIIAIDLQRRLENFGYRVTGVAATGPQAIDSVENDPPDIILMDIMLSGDMDGIDTAEIVKERFEIPVMFLTAYSDEKTLQRAKHVEPLGYILKPFKEKELYTSIDIALYKYGVDRQLKWQERWYSAMFSSIEDGIIAEGNNGAVDGKLLEIGAAELEGFFIAVVGDDDVVSGLDEREDGGGNGAHAGRKDHAVFGAFEIGQSFFSNGDGGVAVAGVFIPLFLLVGVAFDFPAV